MFKFLYADANHDDASDTNTKAIAIPWFSESSQAKNLGFKK